MHRARANLRARIEPLESRALLSTSVASTPYLPLPYTPGQIIEAENYDRGGEGVAYHVIRQVTLPGKPYRPGDAVVVQPGGSNGYDVGYTTVGEWIQYTISNPASGTFRLSARVADTSAGAAFNFAVDGVNVTGTMVIPDTGDWQAYQTVTSRSFKLSAGTHVLRLYMDRPDAQKAAGNYDWFEVSAVLAPGTTQLAWHPIAPIPQAIAEGLGASVNGKLYVFSGFTDSTYYPSSRVYCYDPIANTWTRLHDMPVATTNTQAAVYGNYIYIAGGYPPNSTHTYQLFATTNVWRYDTVNDSWAAMPALPAARGAGNVVMVGSMLHYISGDDINRVDLTTHWVLNVNNPSAGWKSAAPIPVAVNKAGAVALNGLIYVMGGDFGQDANSTAQTFLQIYNPLTNTWSKGAALPDPRSRMTSSCTVYDGEIIMAAGSPSFTETTSEIDAYDPISNTWTKLTSLPAQRGGGICQNVGGFLVFTTGDFGFQSDGWAGIFS